MALDHRQRASPEKRSAQLVPSRHSETVRDLLALAVIVAANPVLYNLDASLGVFHPDTIKYVTLARGLIADSTLFIPSFGHVDTGQILPPLYPLFIAFGSIFSKNLLACAEYASNFSLILASVPLYYLGARSSSRLFSVFALCLLQIHGKYHEMALSPLTEALFILMTSIALLVISRERGLTGRALPGFLAGVCCALPFLTRQIGIVFLLVPVGVIAITMFKTRRSGRPAGYRYGLMLLAGFSSLAAPYFIALYLQTGAGPLSQTFRRGAYEVRAVPEDLRAMAEIEADSPADYRSVYAQRRALRRLNADASEMYAFLVVNDREAKSPGASLLQSIVHPARFSGNLWRNLGTLKRLLGVGAFVLFAASMVFPLTRLRSMPFPYGVVWLWIVVYLCGLSLITDKLERYVVVLVPFAFLQMAAGTHTFLGLIRLERRWVARGTVRIISGAIILALCGWSMPVRFDQLRRQDKIWEDALPLQDLRRVLPDGAPVFCLFPVEAYLLGGTFRTLPNDELARVAEYGKRTGVRWLVVRRDRRAFGEAGHYTHAAWYRDPLLAARAAKWIRLRASTADGSMFLYEITW
jgi:hypothetical protein